MDPDDDIWDGFSQINSQLIPDFNIQPASQIETRTQDNSQTTTTRTNDHDSFATDTTLPTRSSDLDVGTSNKRTRLAPDTPELLPNPKRLKRLPIPPNQNQHENDQNEPAFVSEDDFDLGSLDDEEFYNVDIHLPHGLDAKPAELDEALGDYDDESGVGPLRVDIDASQWGFDDDALNDIDLSICDVDINTATSKLNSVNTTSDSKMHAVLHQAPNPPSKNAKPTRPKRQSSLPIALPLFISAPSTSNPSVNTNPPAHIAHNPPLLSLLLSYKLSFSVMWEMTRFYLNSEHYRFSLDEWDGICRRLVNSGNDGKGVDEDGRKNTGARRVSPIIHEVRDRIVNGSAYTKINADTSPGISKSEGDNPSSLTATIASAPSDTAILRLIKEKVIDLERSQSQYDVFEELDKEENFLKNGRGDMLLGCFSSDSKEGALNPNAGVQDSGKENKWYGGQVEFALKLVDLGKNFPLTTTSRSSTMSTSGNGDSNSSTTINPSSASPGTSTSGMAASKPLRSRTLRYTFRLEEPRLSKSNRVTRTLGSRRVLSVSLPDHLNGSNRDVANFFQRKFIFLGKVYQAICAKETTIYMAETGDWSELDTNENENLGRKTLAEFIAWHNPMEWNDHQALAKYTSRMALAFSQSVPVLRLKKENLLRTHDILSPCFDGRGKAPAHLTMTDGAGFMNRACAQIIKRRLNLPSIPVAVQARIGGAKGMFVLHPTDDSTETKIWCRDSQIKIQYGPTDFVSPLPEHLTLDLLRASSSGLKTPARLSKEILQCLVHGGVSISYLVDTFTAELSAKFKCFSDWDGPGAMLKLWDEVCQAESVLWARVRRQALGASRAFGYGEEHDSANDILHDLEDGFTTRSTPWAPDLISGLPSSLAETVMAFLAAGFVPHENPILHDKLKHVIENAVNDFVARYKVPVESSAEGFAIPDPTGKLEEHQIYCRSSKAFLDSSGHHCDVVIGDVLATRHPCKVASDIRKFEAVDIPDLHHYVDVIVFSTKGSRSALSWLGGGDYDGDTVLVIWEPSLVRQFTNADECYGDPPKDFLDKNFERQVKSTKEFLKELSDTNNIDERDQRLQTWLLSGIGGTMTVGQYSNFHEKAAYVHGYGHNITVRLAHMFCTCLDATKSGLAVKRSVFLHDKRLWDHLKFFSRGEPVGGYTINDGQLPSKPAKRNASLCEDIIDIFFATGKRLSKTLMNDITTRQPSTGPNLGVFKDESLAQPYESALARASDLEKQPQPHPDDLIIARSIRRALDSLRSVVDQAQNRHLERISEEVAKRSHSPGAFKRGDGGGKGPAKFTFTNLPIVDRQDILRELSAEYARDLAVLASNPNVRCHFQDQVHRIAASYAYMITYAESAAKQRFPYEVAFRELCDIKAKGTGISTTITHDFAERYTLHRASLNLYK